MKQYLYGVDLGGTSIKFGFFSLDGKLLEKFSLKTDTSDNGKNILNDIATKIDQHIISKNINKEDVLGIGIGVPGPVAKGIVYRCVNLGWGIVNVKEILEKLTCINVAVSNDANIAGLGELWQGSGSGFSNLIFITLGTGVGGAIIVENKIINGHMGASGEIGHAPTLDHSFKCNCGKMGCLETVASATGVVNLAKKILNEEKTPSSLRNEKYLSAKVIFDAAKKDDKVAMQVIEAFGKNLGFSLANFGIVTNPEAFIFGGGVSQAGDIILDVVKKYFDKYAFTGIKDTKFKIATLGNDSGIYGAAYLAKGIDKS